MNNKREALRLRLRGLTYQQIGEELGISRQRVQQLTSPPSAIRKYVLDRFKNACSGCGVAGSLHIHHVNAKGMNGENYNDIANLIPLCVSCHFKAHSHDPSGSPVTCRRCGNEWTPRVKQPIQCPRCKSLAWDEQREEK